MPTLMYPSLQESRNGVDSFPASRPRPQFDYAGSSVWGSSGFQVAFVAFGKADHDTVIIFEPRSSVWDEPGRGI